MQMIRAGVVGAGKMGQAMCIALIDDPAVELVAVIDPARAGVSVGELVRRDCDVRISDRLDALAEARVDVAVDFTHPEAVFNNAIWYLTHEVHSVIGTSGMSVAEMEELRDRAEKGPAHLWFASDFSITGAILLHLAKFTARFMPEVELIEGHSPTKADSPSGTTVTTAQELAKVRAAYPLSRPPVASKEVVSGAHGGEVEGIRVHSLRISCGAGFEQILFSLAGAQITLTHIPNTASAMAHGALAAVKAVQSRRGFTWGLDPLLGLD
jgi:4-hydroxy-tetrahydrodipicolinate reductase